MTAGEVAEQIGSIRRQLDYLEKEEAYVIAHFEAGRIPANLADRSVRLLQETGRSIKMLNSMIEKLMSLAQPSNNVPS